jgi:hypothetical protein
VPGRREAPIRVRGPVGGVPNDAGEFFSSLLGWHHCASLSEMPGPSPAEGFTASPNKERFGPQAGQARP